MDTNIRNEDLNGVDYLNGVASVSSKLPVFGLKGSPAKYAFSLNQEWFFLQRERQFLYSYERSRYKWCNLPPGLTQIRLEEKILKRGSCLVIKVDGEYFATHYQLTDYNIYGEPTIVRIMEPKSPFLHNKVINVAKGEGVIIRNNPEKTVTEVYAIPYIDQLEKTFFQIKKNIFASAPKGLLNLQLKNADEPKNASIMAAAEKMINSENTWHISWDTDDIDEDDYGTTKEPFIKVELTDRTDNLIKNYLFIKELLKELVGANLNAPEKKERLINNEINSQQGFSMGMYQDAFNTRKQDIETLNETFGLEVSIETVPDTRDGEKPKEEQDVNMDSTEKR